MARSIPQELARLAHEVKQIKKGQRYAHGGSIENSALEVKDNTGSLRAIVGVQADGTTAVNIVNGPPPPTPTVPVLGSVLGGITVSWDGSFVGAVAAPLDWQRVEVHASTTDGFTPGLETLKSTIETPRGGTIVVPCEEPVHVRLVARSTSGVASEPTAPAGPLGPTPVVADDIVDGIVTTVKLADAAVTAAKVRVGAIGADQLALGIGNLAPDPSFEGAATEQLVAGLPDWTVVTPGNNSPKALHVDCTAGAVTWKNLVLGRLPVLPGERHFLAVDYRLSAAFNGSGAKLMFRYEDAAGGVTGWGVADKPPVPGGGWDRATAQVQAPTGTVTAVLMVEASQVTAGEVWFDNAEVRTLVAGGMIAAGAVTANEIAAGSIQTAHLVADAVQAGNIAAGAVTTAKLDALAVTGDKIAANAITAEKILAGAVDATALAADAITGKTITGGTITGSLIQTATSGARVTLNEGNANKVLVYDATTAIGELSERGLLLQGDNGALLWLNPDADYPYLRLTNAARTNNAYIQVIETTPGAADLGIYSGIFTGSGFTDMRWRTFTGNDFAVIERIRNSNDQHVVGGRLLLRDSYASLSYLDSGNVSQSMNITVQPGMASVNGGRLSIQPPASASAGLVVNPAAGHTGSLMTLAVDNVTKMSVDKDGNTSIQGVMTAGNIATGTVTITPSAAHTPTGTSVSFPALKGSTFRGYATAVTTVPGVRSPVGAQGVTGVSVSSVTSSSLLVWVNRENTTATIVNWMVIGS